VGYSCGVSRVECGLHFLFFDLVGSEPGDAVEGLLDSRVVLSRSLEELVAAVILGPQFRLRFGDLSLLLFVCLVSEDHERELAWVLDASLVDELRLPGLDVVEGFLGGDVVDNHAAV